MLRRFAILAALMGAALNAGLCVCSEEHDGGGHSHEHSHSSNGEENDAPRHDHGSGEDCGCSGPSVELLCQNPWPSLGAFVSPCPPSPLDADAPPSAVGEPHPSWGPTGSGPPRPAGPWVLLLVHRLNL